MFSIGRTIIAGSEAKAPQPNRCGEGASSSRARARAPGERSRRARVPPRPPRGGQTLATFLGSSSWLSAGAHRGRTAYPISAGRRVHAGGERLLRLEAPEAGQIVAGIEHVIDRIVLDPEPPGGLGGAGHLGEETARRGSALVTLDGAHRRGPVRPGPGDVDGAPRIDDR